MSVMDSATLEMRTLSPVGGAEIAGVDLSRTLTPDLKDAFLAHRVLVFRDQRLTADQQHALTLQFGEIEEHVARLPGGDRLPLVHTVHNLDEHGQPTATPDSVGNYSWHTDKSYHVEPSLMTMLHAMELAPDGGGDTQFANTAAGYAALPTETKRDLAGLQVVHSWEASRRNLGGPPASDVQKRERPPITHPLGAPIPKRVRRRSISGCTPRTSSACRRPRDARCSLACSSPRRSRSSCTFTRGGPATS